MVRIRILGYLVSAALVLAVVSGSAGCSSESAQPSPHAQGAGNVSGKVIVFAAASLKPAFTQVGQRFKADNPGSSIDFEFAGSSELATQLTQGATSDVFASADTAQMDKVRNAGLLAGVPANFASNTLVIVTAPGNPKKIATLVRDPGDRGHGSADPGPVRLRQALTGFEQCAGRRSWSTRWSCRISPRSRATPADTGRQSRYRNR